MDITELLSQSGISFGALTLAAAVKALAALLIGIVLIRVFLSLFDRAMEHSEKLSPLKKHVRPIVKGLLALLLALVVLDSLGVQVTSLIALLSVAGLAVSLALQNSLANIAGGIMILTAQPYGIGDYVSIDGTEGTVDFIRLSHTKLHTPDNKEVQIPNSTVAGATITNYNRLGRRRLDLTFTASYDAPTEDVYAALRDAMARFAQILPDPAPEVHVKDYGASSIAYLARMWVPAADYWTVNWGVIEAVRETFAAHNVEMTYDHLNVHMEK
ncbi:MAG: mechanosensitive ion channel family protein [Oscillospiraceae bacterium]|nr:mechanosensitive ion channel family protein [Oscillospiraceae bacterium]